MPSTEREIHMLCQKCHRVINGTMAVTLDSKVPHAQMSVEVKCPVCNSKMIDADNLSIPVLRLLHEHGYLTQASCDRYHDGIKDPDYSYANNRTRDGLYNGPFVLLDEELKKKEKRALKDAAAQFNREMNGAYVADIDETEDYDDDDEEVLIYCIQVNGKNPDGAVEANAMLLKLVTLWIDIMRERGITHKPGKINEKHTWSTLRHMPNMK